MNNRSEKKSFHKILVFTLLLIFSLLTLIPFIWMISASFKANNDVFSVPIQWIPKTWHPENYSVIWTRIPLLTFFKNTAILSIVITLIQLFTSSFAAYGFSKMHFKGRNLLFLAYIGTIAVPWQSYMIPQFIMMRQLGLSDTLLSLILLQAFSAFGVFLLKQYYSSIPDSLCESARIDGLSEWGIYRRIILPLTKPALASLTIITFVNTWNDYMGPFIYLSSTENKTIQLGLKMFVGLYDTEYALIMAASVLSVLPVAIVFLAMQKYFVEGIASSGVKG
ncbi:MULTISPECIES: carbohydrate ABC transporter permease [Enterococcus]|uniref:ABC transporter permease n=2 Tax=Enterococcus mundtii TaxID=53346 RepID=A0A1L8UK21_ENTMU|nr:MULTISPECIES: carbohydrate ABC transporter permease [Enterococcus]GEN17669.1 ABC transporter permease [Ligilactobacillus acidipiscis]AUB52276.1 sugar ABC transporter ATP-binding protein [Enterococcus mundtii]MBE9910630.1 carbohydrate ABC transporter permease [Enterococcus mundtii]MRI74363.1 carbohydrate ABC transporter permease [Enterococcus mundtii]MZZ58174.1 ABC transporter permease subunit [Enterococcus mundtii]